MYLIYGKGVVAKSVAKLCDNQKISYEIADDYDKIENFDKFEAIIPSPGIPSTHKIYKTGKIISELDFANQFLPKNFDIISITGTDGKSTTTWMIYKIIEKIVKNKKIFLSGNFEIPFSQTVLEIIKNNYQNGMIIIEISSFMSYFIGKNNFKIKPFSPDYTIFTNLKTDHLNWHSDLEEYIEAKINLIKNTKKKSIINYQIKNFLKDKKITNTLKNIDQENIIYFGDENNYIKNDNIFINKQNVISLSETNFSGNHNAMNLLSVLLTLNEIKIEYSSIKNVIKDIKGLPHRLENIGKYGKVTVIEDSKSTSSQSLEAGLSSFGNEKNLLLIVGGTNKGDSFDHLEKLFEKRVKKIACIGETKDIFVNIAKKINIEYLKTDDIEEAVKWLYSFANQGDILMLSPGCASFGLFKDYLDRAKKFRDAVAKNIK